MRDIGPQKCPHTHARMTFPPAAATPHMTTIYATLGVQPDATLDEIKRAYRRAAMKWHPDRNPGREAEAYAAFQEIREAYAILSDTEQRRVYDEVFAQEMQRWQAEQEVHEAQEREAQRERERLAQERYETMVATAMRLSLIHISEPTRLSLVSRMPSSA